MMLNGSHSMLAYSGFLTGKTCVRDVMQDENLSVLVSRHLKAAAALLEPLPNIDYADYASALIDRFANPSIAHKTFQIADDGHKSYRKEYYNRQWKRLILARISDHLPLQRRCGCDLVFSDKMMMNAMNYETLALEKYRVL